MSEPQVPQQSVLIDVEPLFGGLGSGENACGLRRSGVMTRIKPMLLAPDLRDLAGFGSSAAGGLMTWSRTVWICRGSTPTTPTCVVGRRMTRG